MSSKIMRDNDMYRICKICKKHLDKWHTIPYTIQGFKRPEQTDLVVAKVSGGQGGDSRRAETGEGTDT